MSNNPLIPYPTTFLLVDVMYFHAAMQNFANAVEQKEKIDAAEAIVWEIESRIEEIREEFENGDSSADNYEHFERSAIQLENAEHNLGVVYGPYLQSLAISHILCAASLESHINIRAKELLRGKAQEYFERISLETKWLFLPLLIGIESRLIYK